MVLAAVLSNATATVAVSACSPGKPTPGPKKDPLAVSPAPVPTTPVLGTVRGLTLPSEAYKPSAAEQNVVGNAEKKLMTECMRRFGFTWSSPTSQTPPTRHADRLYGVADIDTAQKYGYHLPPVNGRANNPGGHDGSRASTTSSPSELLVLSGSANGLSTSGPAGTYQNKPIPVGGCAGEARRVVTGADEIDRTHLAESITVGMWQKSKSDQRVTAVVKAWSTCMAEAGYTYASPLDAGNDHPEWLRADQPTPAEIQLSVADVRCKQRTNLIGVWFSVESAYETALIQRHFEELTQIKKTWATSTRAAAQILGVPAPPS